MYKLLFMYIGLSYSGFIINNDIIYKYGLYIDTLNLILRYKYV